MDATKITIAALVLWGLAALNGQAAASEPNGLAAGERHSCAAVEGKVWCWGENAYGQLGWDTGGADQPVPALQPTLGGVISISAGGDHTCALISNGDVWCWGANSTLQLGSQTPGNNLSAQPLKVQGLQYPAVAISAGAGHTCALRNNGTVMCWGANDAGQLGHTTVGQPEATPALVIGLTQAVELSAGYEHTCAVNSGGLVLCWGANDLGQLGRGTTGSPQPVSAMVQNLSMATKVSAGRFHTCASKSDGAAVCWGSNGSGQLGIGMPSDPKPQPEPVAQLTQVTSLAAGDAHTCALRINGNVECWGNGSFGRLGTGDSSDDYDIEYAPLPVEGLAGVTVLAAGSEHTCAQQTSGRRVCWGRNSAGQLGIGASGQALGEPQPIGLNDVGPSNALLDGGYDHTCAVRSGGTVACWGKNFHGQLGIGSTDPFKASPQTVAGLSQITGVSTGGQHTCAVRQGTVWCWGSNANLELGIANVGLNALTPVQVAGLIDVSTLSAGSNHTCALKQNGKVWCWGWNTFGQTGSDPQSESHSEPHELPILTGIVAISSGGFYTCALKQDGTAWCWGANDSGQLGLGGSPDYNAHPTPQPVTGLADTIVDQLMTGHQHACLRLTASSGQVQVRCWGNDVYGQLGIEPGAQPKTTPQLVGVGLTLRGVGGAASCASNSLGTRLCWGKNSRGQLALDGPYSTAHVPTISPGFANAIALTFGFDHGCAVAFPSTVVCAGDATWGQRGDGAIGHWPVPLTVIGFDTLFHNDFEWAAD